MTIDNFVEARQMGDDLAMQNGRFSTCLTLFWFVNGRLLGETTRDT
ncbi:MAG: hypothetical protein GY805_04365 [Chloroflexi bacterium]|nr:hypothetical protein [Chloroflexota bacterium]